MKDDTKLMRTMKVSPENHKFLYSICDKKDQTFDNALTKLREYYVKHKNLKEIVA